MARNEAISSVKDFKLRTSNAAVSTLSPRKFTNTLRCAILTKSPVKKKKSGSMFSMTLSDKDPSCTVRAVCWEEDLSPLFEPLKTYDITGFKVKRGYYNQQDLELVINSETKVKSSPVQHEMKGATFTIAQIVRGETQNIRFINLKAKVMNIQDIDIVGKYPDKKEKRDITLADQTGEVNLVLWQETAKDIPFNNGDVLLIRNVVVSSFNKRLYVTTSFETSMEPIDEILEIDEAVTNAVRAKPSHVITTLQGHVQAFKDFTSLIRCLNCRTEIAYTPKENSTSTQFIVKCSACSAVFMAKAASAINECKFMFSDDWYTGRTAVGLYFSNTVTLLGELGQSIKYLHPAPSTPLLRGLDIHGGGGWVSSS